MPDAKPIKGSDPYEILGVTKMDTLSTIEIKKENLISEYQTKVKKAKRNGDNPKFKQANEALDEIEKAWGWMKNNHTPPLVDEPVSVSIPTSDPVVNSPVTVRVEGDTGPIADVRVDVDRDDVDSEQTDASGEATFRFNKQGAVQFRVPTTDSYSDGTDSIVVDPRSVDLSFHNPPSSVEFDTNTEFVVKGDGSTISGAKVTVGSTPIGDTTSDGSISHTFTSTGSRTIAVSKPDDDTATYDDCSHPLTVTEKTVQLEVIVDGSDFEYGDDVIVEVTDPDGNKIENAEVTIGANSETTNPNGRARLPLQTGGNVTVRASKTARSKPISYQDGKTKLTISKGERHLEIKDIEGPRMESTNLTIHVIDGSGSPLSGVDITTNWDHDTTTDDNGETTISLNDTGPLVITAEKETDTVDYGHDQRKITIDEFTRQIEISKCPDTANPGDTIEIKVTDSTGSPVAGAEVRCDRQIGKSWQTDDSGRATLSLTTSVGVRKITVEKDGGEEDTNVHVLT